MNSADMRQELFAYAAAYAVLLSLLVGLYPPYAAARLDPVEAVAVD